MELHRLNGYYYQQGYNYVDSNPSNETKLGGGCQASSLLIAVRIASNNINWTMNDIQTTALELGLVFYDRGYADKISYASIPIIAASLLPTAKVTLSIETEFDDIKSESTNEFGREANRMFINMPPIKNLQTLYGLARNIRVEEIIKVLKNGGLSIPLVHLNTLCEVNNPNTDGVLHAVVLIGYNEANQSVKIIDPDPGFSGMSTFNIYKKHGTLKIPSDRIKSVGVANRIAKRYHPMKSVLYEVSAKQLERSLRPLSTTISPK